MSEAYDLCEQLNKKHYNTLLTLNAYIAGEEPPPEYLEGVDDIALKLLGYVKGMRNIIEHQNSRHDEALMLLHSMASYIHDEGEEGSYCDALTRFKEKWNLSDDS